ncbi:S8 family peptidase [Halomarina salina]|uniref:S8 family peptidase n=1 Tax=Halomarina salina TaxID=1872699 RepID=A0ABD5RIL2_9EURY|nr:S8 family peptidase [Halomarina salina]
MSREHTTRRTVLKTIGAGAAGTGLLGTASAEAADRGNFVVGVTEGKNLGFVRDQANSVKRELHFGRQGKAVAGNFAQAAINGLLNNPHVRYIEPDGQMHAIAQSTPWGIDRVDADVAHDNGSTGEGADVAIVDTGIDSDHPDLQANLGEGVAVTGCGDGGFTCFFSGNDNTCNEAWDDDNDHGTHCAGIANAVNNSEGVVGVSTQATLHAVKVLDCAGSGAFSDIAAGIEAVADNGWDVASMSLGADSGSQTVKDACQYAADEGVFLVAAAGNSGPCSDCVGYPAAYDTVMAVSSTNESDGLSEFSSTGPEVEIAAPGSNINSTVPGGYAEFSGTSMACPHVAGAAGQLIADGSSASGTRTQLKDTAEDVGLAENESGSGLLDVAASLGYDSSDST